MTDFKKAFQILLPYIISGIILLFLFNFINLEDFSESFSNTNKSIILIIFILYIFTQYIDTLRFSLVFDINQFGKLINILSYSNLLLNILPMRLGEISYVNLINKYYNKSYLKNTKNLLFIRFIDYVVGLTILLISSAYLYFSTQQKIFLFISLAVLSTFVFAISISITITFVLKQYQNLQIFNKFKTAIESIQNYSPQKVLWSLILTFIYWVSRFVTSYIILNGIGIEANIPLAFLISIVTNIVGALPINSAAGFGSFEASGSFILGTIGYTYQNSLVLMLSFHILSLFPILVYGPISWIILKIFHKKETHK